MRKLGRLLFVLMVIVSAIALIPQLGGACDPVGTSAPPCSK
jgi:hypothetical protein